ncbi:MAG: hypothetical protein IPL65_11950 [Lewinellaceae bacterium]|nr:hypothetical protein [Lewinellaceae bacterium]
MVKELNELVWYTQKSVWRDEALLEFLCNGKPEVMDLYKGLQAQHFRSDEEAARVLGMSLSSFKKYGKILQSHLNDCIFFFNDEKAQADVTLKNIFAGAREMAAVRMLSWRACRLASKDTALRLLRRGQHYDWPEFVVDAALALRESVIRIGGSQKDFEHYASLYHTYREHLDWEHRSWEYYLRMKIPSRKHAVVSRKLAAQIEGYLEELAPQVNKVPSYFFHLYYYILRNHFYFQTADYPGLVSNCEEALAYFKGKRYPVQNPLSIFYYTKVVAYTLLGQFDQGRKDATESLRILEEGSVNWFNAKEIFVYLEIHAGRYPEALAHYVAAARHRRMGSLFPLRQENWHILGAYCYILHHLCNTPLPEGFPAFRSRKFLNSLPVYSRDKNGMNLAILIAHVLLQLIEGREEEIWERILALEKYRSRHLRKEKDARRVVIFIRVLSLLPKSNFEQTRFLEKAAPLMAQLQASPLQFSTQAHELEVIPYAQLVSLVAEYLPRRQRG